MADGWVEVHQQDANKFYYWKATSGEVSWTIPGTPWRKFLEPKTAKVYYCSVETQKTIWKLPDDIVVPPQARPSVMNAPKEPEAAPKEEAKEAPPAPSSASDSPQQQPQSSPVEQKPVEQKPVEQKEKEPAKESPKMAPIAAEIAGAPSPSPPASPKKEMEEDETPRKHEREASVILNPKKKEFPDSENEDAMIAKNSGNSEFNKKNYSKAKEYYDRAIELDNKCSNFFFNRSAAFFCLRDLHSALTDARTAVELLPENTSALARLGFTLLKCKHYDEAEEIYKRAIKIEPGSTRCQRGLQRVQETRQHAAS